MSLPTAKITLGNGALGGLIQTEDGIGGLMLTGAAEGTLALGTPFTLNRLADLTAMGVTATNNAPLIKQVKELYNEAGDGALMYFLVVATSMTVAQMADGTNANGIKKLIDFGAGNICFVCLLGDTAGNTVTNGLDANVYTAAASLQVTLNNYATNNQWPMRGIVGGNNFSGVSTALTNMKASTLNRAAVFIGDTVSGVSTALGMLLGRLAAIPVQRKISRVKSGALTSTTGFIGTVDAALYTTIAGIHDKGFITLRTFAGKNGYFFTSDPTLTADTDDYNTLAHGRVIDKAWKLAYATYVNEVDDEVPLNADGTIDAGYAKYLEQIITNQINGIMVANGECSGVKCFVDTAQNVLSTNKVAISLKIQPVGYASELDVLLGFAASL